MPKHEGCTKCLKDCPFNNPSGANKEVASRSKGVVFPCNDLKGEEIKGKKNVRNK